MARRAPSSRTARARASTRTTRPRSAAKKQTIEWAKVARPAAARAAAGAGDPGALVPIGSVQTALGRAGAEGVPFLVELVGKRLGSAPRLRVELAWERPDQWMFRVTDARGDDGPGLALRVARSPGLSARVARAEYQHMRALYNLDPSMVPLPLAGGVLHVQRPRAAVLFAYITQWLDGFEQVGFDQSGQLVLGSNGRTARVDAPNAQRLRERMCEVLARAYDPARQTAIWPIDPRVGDFVARPDGEDFQVRLVAPRGTDRSVPPARLVALMCDPQWEIGGRRLKLAPDDPARFEDALARGFARRDGDPDRGRERARRYLSAYDALRRGRARQRWNPARSSSSTSPR